MLWPNQRPQQKVGSMPESVAEFVAQVVPAKRQRDAHTLLELYGRISGEQPELYGTIIGFGHYHYQYASGREGDAPAGAFAPRKAATSIYLPDGIGAHRALLDQLGPHREGVGCLYLTDLEQVDLAILEQIITRSYATLSADTYRLRARDGEE